MIIYTKWYNCTSYKLLDSIIKRTHLNLKPSLLFVPIMRQLRIWWMGSE
jgi:hypothetical protein